MYMKVNYSNKAVPWGMSNNCCSYLRVSMGAHTYSELKLGNYQWQGIFFSFYLPIGTSSVAFCLPWHNFYLVLSCYLTFFTFLLFKYLFSLLFVCIHPHVFQNSVTSICSNTKDHLSCCFIHKVKTRSVLDCIEVGQNILFYYYCCCIL